MTGKLEETDADFIAGKIEDILEIVNNDIWGRAAFKAEIQ
jgi:hypothetical protein